LGQTNETKSRGEECRCGKSEFVWYPHFAFSLRKA
jgi:hypothetical protein